MAVTDVHVHLAALPTPANGCLMSRRMRNSLFLRTVAWQQGISLADPPAANRRYMENLERELAASAQVARAVILGMDGAYDSRGDLDEARTDFLISNDEVFRAVAGRPRLLPGVSINPARKDALDELESCAQKGAALVKILPNAQNFDPSDGRFLAFYRAMARLGLPLLSHVGYEFSLFGREQSYGDLARLKAPLEQGVTVIAAHGCGLGLFFYERYWDVMLDFVEHYEKFYMDTSALTLPNRVSTLIHLRREPRVFSRLIFGTDYPLPCFSYPSLAVSFSGFRRARAAANRFDRHFNVLETLGIGGGTDFLSVLKMSRGT